ncbi:CHAP domain-containing protein [Flavobacterium sp. F-65]|uniref:CHAP domain-containing protein n=1 Tax=Flavobacterium pisciphilum TaxID=2893755 RepID=A0ABS8MW74_9FLAO|nr:CHAP domain-containing protein [Flavobacterium sp. F-65]MCC9073043.1 CHAP domain-containing protein [Flavobacterium sp. F-65]
MKTKRWTYFLIGLLLFLFSGIWAFKKFNFNSEYTIGQPLDSLNGICVYYNGGVNNVTDRNLTADNYNLGLKYQCVEFVKRYYYEHFNHKMPDSYGHAKDFFNAELSDGQKNEKRDLTQYTNPSTSKPKVDDLLIYSGTIFNRFGHVAIVSNVTDNEIEIIQQNPGPFSKSREVFPLLKKEGKWTIDNDRILGWLRKE